ncbi:MAG: alpha-glucan family phosphorylase [Chitinophagales bacterium]
MLGQLQDNQLKLKRIFIESKLPKELQSLKDLAHNLWWSWNKKAIELFEYIAGDQWETIRYNPVELLQSIGIQQAKKLLADEVFMTKLQEVTAEFKAYMEEKPAENAPKISYFCMEYGLHTSMRLYSGGLGVLAGDFLKEASDMNVDMVAVGLLYRYGYFQQELSLHGDQSDQYPVQKFTQLPVKPVKNANNEWIKITIELPGRLVFAKVWELNVGRIKLYLLDTDIDENSWEDRSLTHRLYGGDNEHRLKQEILLGIGGVKALRAINVQPHVFHCNEGHAAFLGLERLQDLIQNHGLTFAEATEVVRASALFTTHTPVPAGHDYFHEGLLRNYIYPYTHKLNITWEQLMALGKKNPDDIHESFSMSNLAVRLSQEVNGVSKLHGTVSQKMFNVLYPAYNFEELHIGYVTNSVHYPTWIANEWAELHKKLTNNQLVGDQSNKDHWRKIDEVPSKHLMEIRLKLKRKLLSYVKHKLQTDLTRQGNNPRTIFEVLNGINENAIIFGFARRFATYKRAHLLFSNLDRLAKIVNNPEKPVLFVFSGKAHPADKGGQGLIKHIVEVSKDPRFAGKILFLENYHMESAKLLVQGVDVWLNTPTRPKEASGTSGMKAAMNGVMNFSVLDGWWAEGYRPDAGWALTDKRTYTNQELQNELDAETIYNVLETEIIPTYFDTNEEGISESWVTYIRKIIGEVAPDFTMKRMMDHYFERFYSKLHTRGQLVLADNFAKAKHMAAWKQNLRNVWHQLEVVSMDVYDTDNHSLPLGDPFNATITFKLNNLNIQDFGVEIVFFKREDENNLKLIHTRNLALTEHKNNHATFKCEVEATEAGVYEYGFRIVPQHSLLPHKQDLELVRWL